MSLLSTIKIMKIESAKASAINGLTAFYHAAGYGGSVAPEDQVVYATEKGQTIGVGRLSSEKGVFVLRGMRVLKEHRGRGVGKSILDLLVTKGNNRDCYCIPYGSLRQLYSAKGFNEIAPDEAPDFLRNRFKKYRVSGLDVILMRRKPSN